ncbi:MAG: sodium:proton antiporter [Clostridia bacterium]|nr:sodium:proton antiporter [Clostridia bacterium]
MMADAYQILSVVGMGTLAVLMVVCLIRCALGPRVSDRIMAVNMVSTLTIIMVGIMTVYLKEGYLADVALVYAILSFLAVIVLCKVYTGIYRERRHAEAAHAREMKEQEEKACS